LRVNSNMTNTDTKGIDRRKIDGKIGVCYNSW